MAGKTAGEMLRAHRSGENRARLLRELQERVSTGEARYGVMADDAHAAIEEGSLIEDLAVCIWLADIGDLRWAATNTSREDA